MPGGGDHHQRYDFHRRFECQDTAARHRHFDRSSGIPGLTADPDRYRLAVQRHRVRREVCNYLDKQGTRPAEHAHPLDHIPGETIGPVS